MLNTPIHRAGEAMPRHRVEAAIEFLINYLDSVDPDAYLEPTTGWNPYGLDELEGDDADNEPSIGWTDRMAQCGAGWSGDNATTFDFDLEYDPADREDDMSDSELDEVEDWRQPVHLVDMAGAL